MLTVDLSNIWSHVSLPELLGEEKALFDAHLQLRTNEPEEKPFLGWLGASESVTAKTLHSIRKAAEEICAKSDYLLVVGSGGSYTAAKAGVNLLGMHSPSPCKLLFTGNDLSSQTWLETCRQIEGKEISLLIISPKGTELETCIASRSIRWMMQRRYGSEAKSRIFVSALAQAPMAQMALEEGYTFLPMPQEPGGGCSALSSASLLPMAVADIEPLEILEGAAEAWRQYDIRAFENPVWLYAGARLCLEKKRFHTEILAALEPSLNAFGAWWRQYVLAHTVRGGVGLMPLYGRYPEELSLYERALCGAERSTFETVLQNADCAKSIGIEMDWKDYDGLGCLAGKSLGSVREKLLEALCAAHEDLQIPLIRIECPKLCAETLGELFYFFELSSMLCACCDKLAPFAAQEPALSAAYAEKLLGKS